MSAKLRTVAGSNNRVHTPRSLYYCLFAPHTYIAYGVVLGSHSVRGESHIQRRGCNTIIIVKAIEPHVSVLKYELYFVLL